VAEYVNVPEETDPDVLAQDAFEYLESKQPSWTPSDGQLDTWMITAIARMISVLKDTASDVRTNIFRWFGATVFLLPPQEETSASVKSTWKLTDTEGHTIEAGTAVGVPNAAGELIPFEVAEDVVVPTGQKETAAGGVTLLAVNPGTEANGLGKAGTVCKLEDQFPWVEEPNGITLTEASSGGQEEETDEAYLNRLVSDIRLMALAPITFENYAVLARNIAGVYRAVAINLYRPTNNVHTGKVTNGSAVVEELTEAFIKEHVTVGTEVTGEGLPSGCKVISMEPAAGKVTLSHNAESSHTGANYTFIGMWEQEKCVTVALVNEQGLAVSGAVEAEVKKYLEERREVNYIISVIAPTYTEIDVEFECKHWPGWEAATVKAACKAAIEEFLNPAKWGLPPFGDKLAWYSRELAKVNDIIAALGQVQGVKDVNFVKIRRHGVGAYEEKDITLTGVAALAKPGTIEGTVV